MESNAIVEGEIEESKQMSPLPPPEKILQPKMLTFPAAIAEVTIGKKITKLEWNDKSEYGYLNQGELRIILKGVEHQWIVTDGDLNGSDWYVLQDLN